MKNSPAISRIGILSVIAVLAFSACSEDTQDSIETAVDNVATDLENEGRTAISEGGEALDEAANDALGPVARNLAAEFGEAAFDDAGHPLEGKLECSADPLEDRTFDIACEGTTQDGEDAVLEGTTSEIPGASASELEGTFTGTVAGEEVFSVDKLGD